MQRSRRSLGRLFAKAISRLLHVQSEIHGMAERATRRRHDHSVTAAWRARISTTSAPPPAPPRPTPVIRNADKINYATALQRRFIGMTQRNPSVTVKPAHITHQTDPSKTAS